MMTAAMSTQTCTACEIERDDVLVDSPFTQDSTPVASDHASFEPPTLSDGSTEFDVHSHELRPVLAHLEAHDELPTPVYKELIGTTSKYAVPLMEIFDAEHLTMRRGEDRVLRHKPTS